jgi:hypothetical protein
VLMVRIARLLIIVGWLAAAQGCTEDSNGAKLNNECPSAELISSLVDETGLTLEKVQIDGVLGCRYDPPGALEPQEQRVFLNMIRRDRVAQVPRPVPPNPRIVDLAETPGATLRVFDSKRGAQLVVVSSTGTQLLVQYTLPAGRSLPLDSELAQLMDRITEAFLETNGQF